MAYNLGIQSVITDTFSFKYYIDPSFYILSYCFFVVVFDFNFFMDLYKDHNDNEIIQFLKYQRRLYMRYTQEWL